MKVSINPSQLITIEFDGKEYPCNKPRLGAVMEFETALAQCKADGKGTTALVIGHLVSCGLPESVVLQLDADQIEAVSAALAPAKKN